MTQLEQQRLVKRPVDREDYILQSPFIGDYDYGSYTPRYTPRPPTPHTEKRPEDEEDFETDPTQQVGSLY